MNKAIDIKKIDAGTFAGWLAIVSPELVAEVAQDYPDKIQDWAPLTEWPEPMLNGPSRSRGPSIQRPSGPNQ